MNIWHKLSIKKKFITVFIIQNISLIGLLFFIGDSNFSLVIYPMIFVYFFSILNKEIKYTYKTFLIYCIFIILFWLPANSFNLMQNFNVDYNQLKDYSGESIPSVSSGRSGGVSYLVLKKNKQGMSFICSPLDTKIDDCYKELEEYFGRGERYGKNLSVKYGEIQQFRMIAFFMPVIFQEKVIYEIKYNDKIIYSYDYFINKFSMQQRNLWIFAVYLILNSVVFCIFYHWIQKNFVQHSH